MALVKMKDLLRRAEEKNIGCGAFSVGNMAVSYTHLTLPTNREV